MIHFLKVRGIIEGNGDDGPNSNQIIKKRNEVAGTIITAYHSKTSSIELQTTVTSDILVSIDKKIAEKKLKLVGYDEQGSLDGDSENDSNENNPDDDETNEPDFDDSDSEDNDSNSDSDEDDSDEDDSDSDSDEYDSDEYNSDEDDSYEYDSDESNSDHDDSTDSD